jgi:diacylglycerol kinase family enzyme
MNAIVLLNAKAGTTPAEQAHADADAIRAAFATPGVTADVQPPPGPQRAHAARAAAASGGDVVVVAAGGDGTQSAVAGALAGTSAVMGVLPMGTLNHFAKDLGLPQDLPAAVAAIATGQPRPVDVAAVNGHVFVNNSSIGLYPRVVRHRDQMREHLGRNKWVAMLMAVVSVFRRFPLVRLTLNVNGDAWHRTIPFVFVGNNQYAIDGLDLGKRARLDAGTLSLYFPNRTGRWGMVRLAFRALTGRLRQDQDFNALCATGVTIETRRESISVALDGEVTHMTPPLKYEIRPGALRVMLPPAPPPAPGGRPPDVCPRSRTSPTSTSAPRTPPSPEACSATSTRCSPPSSSTAATSPSAPAPPSSARPAPTSTASRSPN